MIKNKENRIFLIFFGIVVLYHILLQLNYGDDVEYFNQILGNVRLIDFWRERYFAWSSRIFIETALIVITRVPILWRILDCLICIGIVCIICNLLKMRDREEKVFACFLFLVYPFFNMGEAGWMATTVNYLWPFFFFLIVCKGIQKYKDDERINIREYPVFLFSVLFASNQEQSSILVFVILLYFILWFLIKERKIILFLVLELLINICSILFILLAPGNYNRKNIEIVFFPGYENLTFMDKLYLGLARVEKLFIASSNSIFIIFCFTIFMIIYIKYRKKINVFVAVLPLLILGGHTVLCNLYPNYGIIFFIPEDIYDINYLSYKTYIPMLYLFVVIGSLLFSLFHIFKGKVEKFLFCAVILSVGFASNVIMGFSPTVYRSGFRTSCYLYFVLIFTICYIFHENKEIFCFDRKISKWLGIVFSLWGLASFINIISCIIYTIIV